MFRSPVNFIDASMNSASITYFCSPYVPTRPLPPLAKRARLIPEVSASCAQAVRSVSDYAPISPCAFARCPVARHPVASHRLRGALPVRALHFVRADQSQQQLPCRASVVRHWIYSRMRWGLTQRSTGRAGTRFDLRSPSAQRAGYLAR